MTERILLIGDTQRELQTVLGQAMPAAQVVSVGNYFDGIAELAGGPYSAVLAAAEPIERRPESAVRTLRDLAGDGRVVLFGHPTLEPLSRKMLEFGIDDYLITPSTAAELQQVFGGTSLKIQRAAAESTPAVETSSDSPARVSPLASVPLGDLVLDALLLSPHEAPAALVNQLNAQIGPSMRLIFSASAAAAPAAEKGAMVISQPVWAENQEIGLLQLILPGDEDEAAGRQFMSQLSRLMGKVTGLQERHNRLQKLAITDDLTGLYNGRYFRHFLNRIIEKASTLRFPVTLLLFDIDNFKKYNDQYGHGVGDEILRQTAALMKRCVRDHDLVARISGDEFAVVFWERDGPRQPRDPAAGVPGRPPQKPMQILERFRRLLATQNFPGLGPGGQGTLTISGGLAVFPWDAKTVGELIEAADRGLMFKAKQLGKNTIFLVGGQQVEDESSESES